jgi:hypothetical protein
MKKILAGFIFLSTCLSAQDFQGPFSPKSAGNTSCPFSYSSIQDYLPVENALSSDDLYASASHCDCCDANTRCFETKNYGFNIPLTATINGIVAEVEKKATGGSMVQDNGVELLKGGTVTGISQSLTSNWPAADAYFTYGGPTDLWGASWLPEEINDTAFGLAIASISYTCFGNGTPVISSIDHIRMTIYYTDISTGVVSSQAVGDFEMMIIPNPVSDNYVQIVFPESQEHMTLMVMDLYGRVVDEKIVDARKGFVEYKFDVKSGMYFLEVSGPTGSQTQRVFVE